MLSRAAERGESMSMDQAYQKARKMNPEVDAILTQREKAAEAKKNGSSIDKSRRAASSIRGAPNGASGSAVITTTKKNDGVVSRREQLRAAIDAAEED